LSLDTLMESAEATVGLCRRLGADEVSVRQLRSTSTEVSQRAGRPEKVQESRSQSLRVALMVNGRWSVHVTNDLRPAAVETFIQHAIAATRHLEPDLDRRLPDAAEMGVAPVGPLELEDPAYRPVEPAARRASVAHLEDVTLAAATALAAPLRSATAHVWDGRTERAFATSNGLRAAWASTSQGRGASVTLVDRDGRLPEAYAYFGARHAADVPAEEDVARDCVAQAMRRMGSGPAASGRYHLVLDRRVVGRLLGVLLGAIDGMAVHEQRSCLKGLLDERIGAPGFTLTDDPLVPRGLASAPTDDDGLQPRRRIVVEGGILRSYFIDVHSSRRMAARPTTGSASNLVIAQGDRTPASILAELPSAMHIEGFLGGNSNPASGDFSLGVHGTLYERGEAVASVSEMNLSGTLFELLGAFLEAADDTWRFGSCRTPTLLFGPMQFSGTRTT
jgi:PmbA protein